MGSGETLYEILRKIPRPNYSEMPALYEDLDKMARRIGEILIESELFEPNTLLIRFDRADENKILELIRKNPGDMVPFFVMVCGFSVRELERLYGIKDVYSLRRGRSPSKDKDRDLLSEFARAIKDNLDHPIHLETLLYKFYKNWEEHQKRHYRGQAAEDLVVGILKKHGYRAGKVKVTCKGRTREIDCAIPDDPTSIQVAITIRWGVFRDIVKRAKEYSAEFDELVECYPNIKFVVIYFVSPHERNRVEDIRLRIANEREGKRPYDAVILTPEEIETVLVKKLEEWHIPRDRTMSGSENTSP